MPALASSPRPAYLQVMNLQGKAVRLRPPATLCALALLLASPIIAASSAAALDLNSFRAAHGRAPLRVDGTLAGLAYRHAADMARRGALDHAGFVRERAPLGARAENVSYGCGNEACAILQWSHSPPHRAAMLRQDFGSYGIGSAVSASGQRYWAMELGGEGQAPRGRSARSYMESAAGPVARGARKKAR